MYDIKVLSLGIINLKHIKHESRKTLCSLDIRGI